MSLFQVSVTDLGRLICTSYVLPYCLVLVEPLRLQFQSLEQGVLLEKIAAEGTPLLSDLGFRVAALFWDSRRGATLNFLGAQGEAATGHRGHEQMVGSHHFNRESFGLKARPFACWFST